MAFARSSLSLALLLLSLPSATAHSELACLQSAAGLETPCSAPLSTLESAYAAHPSNTSAVLAAMAGVDTSACCTALVSFNAASCFCVSDILTALAAAIGSGTSVGTLTSTLLPDLASRCAFRLRTSIGGSCVSAAASPPPPVALAAAKSPPPALLIHSAGNGSVAAVQSGNASSSDSSSSSASNSSKAEVTASTPPAPMMAAAGAPPPPPLHSGAPARAAVAALAATALLAQLL